MNILGWWFSERCSWRYIVRYLDKHTFILCVFFSFSTILLIYVFMAAGSLLLRGYSLVVVHKLLIAVASLVQVTGFRYLGLVVVFPGLQSTGSVVVAQGLISCPVACGIFLDQGLNPRLLHWQADSLPLNHQGLPLSCAFSIAVYLAVKIFFLP